MVNLNEAPASAVTRAGVQAPVWVASSPVIAGGLLACAGAQCVMPPRVIPTAYVHQQILGRPSTRKPYESTTRSTAFGGGVKGPHPLREPEPV
jgi:hypothetical protein